MTVKYHKYEFDEPFPRNETSLMLKIRRDIHRLSTSLKPPLVQGNMRKTSKREQNCVVLGVRRFRA
jgi:hypothetical protein